MSRLLYPLFFCSGASGLIYEVVWVREFGNVFGNTVYSASLVIAVFMAGLGLGGYLVGRWADRRAEAGPAPLLPAYGYFELAIALLGLLIAAVLPQLGTLSAAISTYHRDPAGWYVLSVASYLARYGIAVLLLAPPTLLMGGTLTLLIRHLVQGNLGAAGWKIGALYGVNTAGAAVGCFLTDYALVPAAGLRSAQMVAVLLNLVAAAGALRLASRGASAARAPGGSAPSPPRPVPGTDDPSHAVALTALALGLSGFAAMGMEIIWFRHISMLLAGLRSVFSLLLTVVLVGMWLGSLAGGFLERRFGRPALLFIAAETLFALSSLLGLAAADLRAIHAAENQAAARVLGVGAGWTAGAAELWLIGAPILREVGVPALMMGFAFPLGNAMIQRAEASIGRRAGALYLANTVGAVGGALAAGFLLLPLLGMQRSATLLAVVAAAATVPLYAAARPGAAAKGRAWLLNGTFIGAVALTAAALALWVSLPARFLLDRAQVFSERGSTVLAVSEGIQEVIAVIEVPGQGRRLWTNSHPMSSTSPLAQRYMRALAHVPLLSMERPETVLVIGFGVGNTAHAAALHPSVRRLDVADLSRHILAHAPYFSSTNGDVLANPKVAVYLNDGRQHLRMEPPGSYDLITMEPPPIAFAGVGALYSREFYELARGRLRPGGYLTQWLPAYQVTAGTTLAMIRAFVDVFPDGILLSGAGADLILMGARDAPVRIDPARVAARIKAAPAVREDLGRVDLGTVTDIVGTFVGSSGTLARATSRYAPVTDDLPLQEYDARSRLADRRRALPASIFAPGGVQSWCPACFVGGEPVPLVAGLDIYLLVLDRLYHDQAPVREGARGPAAARIRQVIESSGYLRSIIAEIRR